MSESREVLIDAMSDASGMPAQTEMFGAILDALAADPVRVLRWLEGLPCQTCKEARERAAAMADDLPALSKETADAISGVLVATSDALGCSACGGSGILGRDGLLRALGMEPLDKTATRINDNEWRHYTVRHDATVWAEPVPVPEPSGGEK